MQRTVRRENAASVDLKSNFVFKLLKLTNDDAYSTDCSGTDAVEAQNWILDRLDRGQRPREVDVTDAKRSGHVQPVDGQQRFDPVLADEHGPRNVPPLQEQISAPTIVVVDVTAARPGQRVPAAGGRQAVGVTTGLGAPVPERSLPAGAADASRPPPSAGAGRRRRSTLSGRRTGRRAV